MTKMTFKITRDGNDLILAEDGTFVEHNDTISDSIIKIDTLLSTQIIE